MTTPEPGYQPRAGHWPGDDARMETFTVRVPRWPIVQRLFGRNPLIRPSDRVEALVVVLAIVIAVLVGPIAAAAGTAVYDSRSNVYAEQTHDRRTVTATVIDDSVAQDPRTETLTTHARWFAAGAEHIGEVKARKAMKPGDSVEVWVDQDGAQVDAPVGSAAEAAVAAALAIWWSVAIAAAGLVAGTRALLNRARHARWQHDFDDLVGSERGHTSQP